MLWRWKREEKKTEETYFRCQEIDIYKWQKFELGVTDHQWVYANVCIHNYMVYEYVITLRIMVCVVQACTLKWRMHLDVHSEMSFKYESSALFLENRRTFNSISRTRRLDKDTTSSEEFHYKDNVSFVQLVQGWKLSFEQGVLAFI